MDLHSSFPYWLIKNGIKQTYPALQKNAICDILIIGGGISGAFAAFKLIHSGFNVMVIDSRHIGAGSTCSSTALIQYEPDTHLTKLISQYGKLKANRIYELLYETVNELKYLIKTNHIDCELRERNSLYLASSRKDSDLLLKEFKAREKLLNNIEYWDDVKIKEHFPFQSKGAIWSDNSCELDPLKLTASLIKLSQDAGASIHNNTTLKELKEDREKIIAITDEGFTIQANYALIACGYESGAFNNKNVESIKSTFAIISEPLKIEDPWYQSCLIWESARPYLYFRTTSDNRIIAGGMDENFYNPILRDKLIAKKSNLLKKAFKEKFPSIEFNVDYKWAGTFGESKDSLPYIGKTKNKSRKLFTLGFGGNGITFSHLASTILPDIINEKDNDAIQLFSFNR